MGKKQDGNFEHTELGLERRAARFADSAGGASANRKARDFSYTQNREVSWLCFDNRVLDEAFDASVPLFERLKFCAIFQSNMDEWFMIRVGGLSDLAELKRQPADNKSDKTPSEQLDVLFQLLPGLYERRERCITDLEAELTMQGVTRVTPDRYTDSDLVAVSRRYEASLAPILSPMIVDPRHPFPNLRNGVQYVVCALDGQDEKGVLGMVEVPPTISRVVMLPGKDGEVRYTLVEDVVTAMLDRCFGSYVPTSSAVLRVTRNADIDPDGEGVEEEEDYRQHMMKVLKRRQRLQPVRLEMTGQLPENLVVFVRKELGLGKRRVFRLATPLDLSYVFAIEDRLPASRRDTLLFEPFEPQPSPMVDPKLPMRPQVEDHDVLLCYPYEGMGPLLRLLHEAAADDDCISIKITLYRVARHSRLCESLVTAVENGKDVTVLMELRARFDEQNNIEWADRLEDAGCTVIYGSEGFKCHSKICQITYHDGRGISRVTCLGTGNFNEKTARLYSDFMLLTSQEGIAEDGSAFFRNLSLGNLRGTYRHLGVAPTGLKPLVMRGIDREISRAREGHPAQVFLKMNSLTDRDVIDRLAEASQAGVRVIMVVRGICCLLPGIAGKTEGIEVRQIVGRLLEHARVYAFGVDAGTIYLSSADMMTRNTERRVEIAYPVLDPVCRDMVIQFIDLQLADNVKARRLTSEGTWEHVPASGDDRPLDCQKALIAVAQARARIARGEDTRSIERELGPSLTALPTEALRALLTRHGSTGLPQSLLSRWEGMRDAAPANTRAESGALETDNEDTPVAERTPGQGPDASGDVLATHVAEGPVGTEPGLEPSQGTQSSHGGACSVAMEDGAEEAASSTESRGCEYHGTDGAPRTLAAAPAQATRSGGHRRGRIATGLALITLGMRTILLGERPRR